MAAVYGWAFGNTFEGNIRVTDSPRRGELREPVQMGELRPDVFLVSWTRLNSTRLPGVLRRHPLEVVDERSLSITYLGVVLPLVGARELFDCLCRPAVVEHQVVEGDHVRLDVLNLVLARGRSKPKRRSSMPAATAEVVLRNREIGQIGRSSREHAGDQFGRFCGAGQSRECYVTNRSRPGTHVRHSGGDGSEFPSPGPRVAIAT